MSEIWSKILLKKQGESIQRWKMLLWGGDGNIGVHYINLYFYV